jgi:hypothetical protein
MGGAGEMVQLYMVMWEAHVKAQLRGMGKLALKYIWVP